MVTFDTGMLTIDEIPDADRQAARLDFKSNRRISADDYTEAHHIPVRKRDRSQFEQRDSNGVLDYPYFQRSVGACVKCGEKKARISTWSADGYQIVRRCGVCGVSVSTTDLTLLERVHERGGAWEQEQALMSVWSKEAEAAAMSMYDMDDLDDALLPDWEDPLVHQWDANTSAIGAYMTEHGFIADCG